MRKFLTALIVIPLGLLFVVFAGYAVSGVVEKGLSLLVKAVGNRRGAGSDQPVLERKE